jgi:(p)ppGpp synthase/HD superfamily hydrolase
MTMSTTMTLRVSLELSLARQFAEQAHGSQQYGSVPYVHHLDAVADILRDYDAPLAVIKAGYLHDVLEDTATTDEALIGRFGFTVTALVWAVTKAAHVSGYDALQAAGPYAAMVKIADRMANITATLALPQGEGAKYRRRYTRDFPALADAIEPLVFDSRLLTRMWADLLKLQSRLLAVTSVGD